MFAGTLAPMLLAGAIAYPAPLRTDQRSQWVGRTVIMAGQGNRFFRTNNEGVDVEVGLLTRTDYVVVRERDERIWVRQDGVEGWITKEQAKLPDDAVALFTKRLQEAPNDTATMARRSKAYELKGDIEAAIKDYDAAIRLAPAASSWYNNRANLFQKKKDFDRAIQDYDRSIELNPNSSIVRGNRGNAYANRREFAKAIADYDESLRLNPKYINALANRGNAHRELKDFDAALADFDAALKIDPDFAFGLCNRGETWLAKKEFDKAEADMTAAVRADPRLAAVFLHRGNLRRARAQYPFALDDYDHALWLEPKLTRALLERGQLRCQLGEFEKALTDFNAAIQLEPKSPLALRRKAELLSTCPDEKFRDGKTALELARRAVDAGKERDGWAYSALAAACAETGDFDAAIANQERALAIKDYSDEEGAPGRVRLALYKQMKPFRAPPVEPKKMR
jgi:tetratricopeptide (TPR) repeat protein